MRKLFLVVLLCLPALAFGQTTYYLSPTIGSDSAAGILASAPWKTFGKVFSSAKLLRPGDTLVLLDGSYTRATTGLPRVDCTSNADSGTVAAPVTIRAANRAKAVIQGDGASYAFWIGHCSNWSIDGLVFLNADNPAAGLGNAGGAGVVGFYGVTNSALRNSIAKHPNRYGNNQVITVYNSSSYITIEDVEVIDFHRNGIDGSCGNCHDIYVRRAYVNPQGARDAGLPGNNTGPNDAINLYWWTNSLIENSIVEGAVHGIINQGASNHFVGNISIGNSNGFADDFSYGTTTTAHSIDALWVNNVAAGNIYNGHIARSELNSTIRNLSAFGGQSNGIVSDNYYDVRRNDPVACNGHPCLTQIAPGITVSSSLAVGTYGGYVVANPTEFATRAFKYSHGWNNWSGTWKSGTETRDTATTPPNPPGDVDPAFGACRVFVPDSSPMKRRGERGADIGANVLYRYQGGVLTTVPLWNPVTGEFPHGPVIAGVNDVAGKNVFDVHKRLNVNANGCNLPAWYSGVAASPTATAIPSPTPSATATPTATTRSAATATPTSTLTSTSR